ncbi:MAG: hypothetical protein ACE5H9_21660, partial [Anaerolineae bacterium]
ALCEHCDWAYLLPPDGPPPVCPHCFREKLTPLNEGLDPLPYAHPPELLLPFAVSAEIVARRIRGFAGDIRFAPADLKPDRLRARLQRIYLPMWLVDSRVQATWQAEVGFDYEVVSHQESFDEKRGGWVSREVTETRIRWEPRLGRLTRTYDNIPAPALEEHAALSAKLGPFKVDAARPFQAGDLARARVRLPDRPPADAWPETLPAIRAAAAEECRRAAGADHIREFRWTATYPDRNWTLLLLPLLATFYLDDDNRPQPVLIHGQTGRISGVRRASMKRAQRMALVIVALAAVIFAFSLLLALGSLLESALLVLAGLGMGLAVFVGLLAIVPVFLAWGFNRGETED